MAPLTMTKHVALGNDFLVLIDPESRHPLGADFVRTICDRRRGIGADGVLRVRSSESADFAMDYLNADGGRAEMCGNGVRCLAQALLMDDKVGNSFTLETDVGIRRLRITPTADPAVIEAAVTMGAAKVADGIPDWVGSAARRGALVNVGNPHLVLDGAWPRDALIPMGERAQREHDGINLELADLANEHKIDMLVYERGSGPTESCGTGACATAAAYWAWGMAPDGELLEIAQPGGSAFVAREGEEIVLTGPAAYVAKVIWP